MLLATTNGIGMDACNWHGLNVYTLTHGIDRDSWYRYEGMVQTWTNGIEKDSWYQHEPWYRHELMVLTTPLLLTQPVGIILALLTYQRAECCPYARFFAVNMRWTAIYNSVEIKGKFPPVTLETFCPGEMSTKPVSCRGFDFTPPIPQLLGPSQSV